MCAAVYWRLHAVSESHPMASPVFTNMLLACRLSESYSGVDEKVVAVLLPGCSLAASVRYGLALDASQHNCNLCV